MTTQTVRPLRVTIENDAYLDLSEAARSQLQEDQIWALDAAQERLLKVFGVPAYDDGEARYRLEELADALRDATRIVETLWWLAPEYGDDE